MLTPPPEWLVSALLNMNDLRRMLFDEVGPPCSFANNALQRRAVMPAAPRRAHRAAAAQSLRSLLFAALLIAVDLPRDAWSVEKPSRGRARFEVFGMLHEYMARFPDGATIESFYSSETKTRPAVVAHFEKLLRQFCEEEHLALKYEKKNYSGGGIDFVSPRIAEAIDIYYRSGVLDESVFAHASKEDMLRYVAGAYLREGDEKKRAVLYMANASRKMRTVGVILVRLGCTHVRMYSSRMKLVPTSYVLLFSPSPEVKTTLGILSEATLSDLGDHLGKVLSLEEDIGSNAKLHAIPPREER